MRLPIYFMSYVEDEPTKHIVRRLFDYLRETAAFDISFHEGFPAVVGGCGELKRKAPKWLKAAEAGIWFFIVTDLDQMPSPNALGQAWFDKDCLGGLPKRFLFRIAVHEMESWIMADGDALAAYLGIARENMPEAPDALTDPKAELLSVIRGKCTKKAFREMLPVKNQHVGIAYNEKLCEFIDNRWSAERAAQRSPSLARTISRMISVLKEEET